jgi:hypothetical protein
MPLEKPPTREVPRRYAETIFESLPSIEVGIDIPRVSATRLSSGKAAEVKLSVKEKLGREGWDYQGLKQARKGGVLRNHSGELFEVLDVARGKIRIKNHETEMEGEIVAESRTIRAHEYAYTLRDRAQHSRKVKVYDTVYRDASVDTSEFIDSIIQSIPVQCMDVFDEIQIHRESGDTAGSFRVEPALLSDRNVLTIYVNDEERVTAKAIETLYHELGHAIVKYLKGTPNPGKVWKRCMAEDGHPVSEYADKTKYPELSDDGEVEDIADSVKMYLATDGAKRDQARPLRDFCQSRFEKLDRVFEELERRRNGSLFSRVMKSGGSLDK